MIPLLIVMAICSKTAIDRQGEVTMPDELLRDTASRIRDDSSWLVDTALHPGAIRMVKHDHQLVTAESDPVWSASPACDCEKIQAEFDQYKKDHP